MIYFAYGSNINLDHLRSYLEKHGVDPNEAAQAEHALLHDYVLRTNYFAGSHGAGACNIEPAPDHHVEGVVMSIIPAIQSILRVKEGFPRCYEEIDIVVNTASKRASVRALTYIVTPAHRLDIDLPVTAQYRALILAGAKHFDFSESYQEALRSKLRTAPSLLTTARHVASPELKELIQIGVNILAVSLAH